jgi:hypothetical protein
LHNKSHYLMPKKMPEDLIFWKNESFEAYSNDTMGREKICVGNTQVSIVE